ncbi:transmembrane protein 94 isoform X2 [Nematostella vectensis]|uniref:transmembrane protein 94 isoform X2 n=1 Tax=Nematostella vectensis TaxID=45351 RepID=UPI002077576D|nr:transmembrane protein 94 isoform X2 [Nematostella vectensis]
MDESISGESKSFVRRTWSWRHRETAVSDPSDVDLAYMELQSLDNCEKTPEEALVGLTSQQAHKKLFATIRKVLDQYNESNNVKWTSDVWKTLHCNHHASISWISIGILAFEVLIMVSSYALSDKQRYSLPLLEAFLVLIITLANLVICVREENLRRTEVYRRAEELLESCKVSYCNWNPLDYVDPCTPPSPSISMVHTYRDNELISMPCNLLVEGDIISLGPSHTSPAKVQLIQSIHADGSYSLSQQVLEKGDMYLPPSSSPPCEDLHSDRTMPCQPQPRKRFLVKESPYQDTLRNVLQNACNRPVSLLENEMHFIVSTVIVNKLVWVVLGLSLLVNIARFLLLGGEVGHWSEMILLLQGYSVLPLLPLSFPLLWTGLNLYGAARIQVLFERLKNGSPLGYKASRQVAASDVMPYFWNNVRGGSSSLPRTTNLLQVLGSITVWCCVDKVGILSLPNPSVEKVFFLQSKKARSKSEKQKARGRKTSSSTWESDISRQVSREETTDLSSSSSDDDDDDDDDAVAAPDGVKIKENFKGRAAVLNVSNDPESQFGLRFDDKRWQDNLSSLKPLGLNILLNSPCSSPVRNLRLADCTGHLSLKYNLAPVPSHRRCLCLLAKEIGFMDRVLSFFSKEQYVFAVQSSAVPAANFSLQTSSYLAVCKERPVPSMTSVLVKESYTGAHQLLTQGTADVVIDTCSDFWDGTNLCPITAHDRRKVLDFYQRNSMSSYCIAFSYRPVSEVPHCTSDAFFRIPPIFQWISCSESEGESVSEMSLDGEEDVYEEDTGISFSAKDLSFEDNTKVDALLDQLHLVTDTDSYHRILGGQVFIGMVTLQYQAKKDIIPLVEDLNKAGIRFVHFSAEDELKSRVFAERMGLETGWNCHISLDDSSPQDHGNTQADTTEATAVEHGTEGEEKHVSWIDYKMRHHEKEDSQEAHLDVETGDEGERATLLSSHNSVPHDYSFFYNRAKLPRGVHNIRPHLQNVDNVPLLVPLFTDSTPKAVQEMVAIMQEHGEVVCCAGSSFNVDNTGVFLQADISLTIEPMFPQLCLKGLPKDFRSGTPQLACNKIMDNKAASDDESSSDLDNDLSPLALSALLNSLPCALAFHRDMNFKFKTLLKEARRLCFGFRTCFAFILACYLLLVCINFLAQCLLLPPPLTGLHLLWLTCLIVPLLGLSLIGARAEKGLMSMMTGRNDKTFEGIANPFCLHFSLGFLPTCVFVCVVLFPLTLRGFCTRHFYSCHYLLGYRNTTEPWNGLGRSNRQALSLAQDINAFFLVLFFAITSASFVHRLRLLWKGSPLKSRPWLFSVLIVICLQLVFFLASQMFWTRSYGSNYTLRDVPSYVIALVLTWPLASLAITELLKRRYIKLWIRYQRRAKLMFGTKLGMNSPF